MISVPRCLIETTYVLYFSALEDARIWALERKVFQAIMMRTGLERQKERMKFLTRCAVLIYTQARNLTVHPDLNCFLLRHFELIF